MASNGGERNAEYALFKLWQFTGYGYTRLLAHLLLLLGTQTPPTTRVLSRPTTLGDAFSLARIVEARYEDERSTTAIAKPTSSILTIEPIRETTTAADTVAKIEETVEFYTSELKEHGMKPQNGKSNGVMSVLKDEGAAEDGNALLMKPKYFLSLILVLVLLLIEEYGIPESISLQDNTLRARWLGRSRE
ncbi:hypothetical protein Tco_0027107 [Tanacetum coccineum]